MLIFCDFVYDSVVTIASGLAYIPLTYKYKRNILMRLQLKAWKGFIFNNIVASVA